MKIFLSYASQDRALVEPIRLALADGGHDVFFDREDLPPGLSFDARIRSAIERCDLFVFMLSPNSIDAGSYTLTEAEIAQRAFPRPSGRVLPVVLCAIDLAQVPAYLRAVTLHETDGNLTASVAHAVDRIARENSRALAKKIASGIAAIAVVAAGALWLFQARGSVEKDQAPLVRIAAGTYSLGGGDLESARQIYVSAFQIDTLEVTTARYALYLRSNANATLPDEWVEQSDPERGSGLPVIGVDWRDANAYCRWAGRRLPTSAEWEVAARGVDRRLFPWGDDEPTKTRANFGRPFQQSAYKEGLVASGSLAAGKSPFGADDMAGNVSEWVLDWYSESPLAADVDNPKGSPTGDKKTIRGGGWYDPIEDLQLWKRFHASPDHRSDSLGFRCARGE